eukprot:2363175-Prymnesium_polylepis.1
MEKPAAAEVSGRLARLAARSLVVAGFTGHVHREKVGLPRCGRRFRSDFFREDIWRIQVSTRVRSYCNMHVSVHRVPLARNHLVSQPPFMHVPAH